MKSVRILIADDHEAVRKGVRSLLSSRADWSVCGEAANGMEAVDQARALRPGLVLMDVSMPHMDGIEATRIIGRELPDTHVVIVSQNDARIVSRQANEVGARAFVTKASLARELLPTLDRVLSSRARTPESAQSDSSSDGNARIIDWFRSSHDAPHKQDEKLLREHRHRLEMVAKVTQLGFWFCDLPFDKLNWDHRVKEHFWLPPDADVTIDTFYSRLHPDDRERTRRAIATSNAEDTPYDIEYRTVSLDGREKWIRAMGRTFYDAAGRPVRFDGLTLDITERKLAQERERQITAEAVAATAKFRAVFEQTTQFAGIMAKDGTFVEANKLWLETCGYTAEEVLGKPFWMAAWWLNFPDSQEKIRAAVPLAARGIPYREMLHYCCSDGTERLVDFALYPIVDDNGEVLFLHPTGIDITDIKRAEENSRKLAASLEAEVHVRTAELETRNAEILAQSELLREFSQRLLRTQDDERRHIARELHDSAGQTLTVLGMDLAHLIAKATSVAPQVANDAERIQDLVQQLHREIRTTSYLLHPPLLDESGLFSAVSWYIDGLIERSGLEISLIISDELGRLPRDMELVVFRLVQECLTNIHRHSGSKTASIRIGRQNDFLKMEIQDEGKGIPPQRMAEIQSRGSGVGIRGMRERLRQFKGEMKIDSGPSGTRIFVTIPIPNGNPYEEPGASPFMQTGG